jgi:hypothetical protein
MIKLKSHLYIFLLLLSHITVTLAQQDRFSIALKTGTFNNWTYLNQQNIEGIIVSNNDFDVYRYLQVGVEVKMNLSTRLSISTILDHTLGRVPYSFSIFDSQNNDPIFGPDTKSFTGGLTTSFASFVLSYELIRLKEFSFSFSLGPDLMISKYQLDNNFEFLLANNPRIYELMPSFQNVHKPILIHLRSAIKLKYKRVFFETTWRSDFGESSTGSLTFRNQSYDINTQERFVFYSIGFELLKF